MSGSGGGGGDNWRTTGGDDNEPGSDKCAIIEQTVLNSPVAQVVAQLNGDELLNVELEEQPRRRLVAKTANGEVAGAITSARLVDLIECIQEGHSYVAQVLAKTGGRVDIEIRPA